MVKKIFKKSTDEEREAAADQVLSHHRKSLSDIVPFKEKNVISFVEEEEDKASSIHAESDGEVYEETVVEHRSRRSSLSYKKVLIFSITLVVLAVAYYIGVYILPKADIKIALATTPWDFNGEITALINGGDVSAQLFTKTKNLQIPLTATGKKFITSKAKGAIKIYNAYSSESQTLVATTRFLSPDGKIFRLDSAVTVPGATIKDGKITPSNIEVAVTADQAGPGYNIAPVSHWSIPGLKGSPKYEAFYGVSDKPMMGGANGEQAYPSTEDILAAKKKAEASIHDALQGLFVLEASDFTIFDQSSNFKITKSEPIPSTDNSGKYVYFVEAKDDRLAVRRADILNLLSRRALEKLGQNFTDKKIDLKFDFNKPILSKDGKLLGASLTVSFRGAYVRKLDKAALINQAAGKSESELKTLILSVPGIESAKISLWPFWVKTVPGNTGKITLSAE